MERTGWHRINGEISFPDNSRAENIILISRTLPWVARRTYKTDRTVILLCTGGELSINVEMMPYVVKENDLLIVMSGSFLEYAAASKDFSCSGVILPDKFLSTEDGIDRKDSLSAYMFITHNPIIPITDQDAAASILNYIGMVRGLVEHRHPYAEKIIRHLSVAFFYGFGYYYHNVGKLRCDSQDNGTRLLYEFLDLVGHHFRTERKVSYYAMAMGLTPEYLSLTVKSASGKTPKEWIESFVLSEAKVLLRNGAVSILQISEILNFPNQSFFGKFFKRLMGQSPKTYRESLTESRDFQP